MKRMKMHKTSTLLLTAASVMSLGHAAWAQDVGSTDIGAQQGPAGDEDIVVTARQRAESLQDVPDSISALSSKLIEQKNIQDIKGVSVSIPNMGFATDLSPASLFINMRGISTFRGSEPGVSVIIDNIQVASAESLSQALNDIQQIEILKGPQAALYGRNSIAGAINITTKKPTNDLENSVMVGYGNGDDYNISVSSSGALIKDKLYFRVNANYRDFGGVINNNFLDKKADFLSSKSIRARLLWEPDPDFSLDVRFNYDKLHSGAYYYGTVVDNNFQPVRDVARRHDWPILSEVLTVADRDLLQSDLVAEYRPGFGGTLRYVFSFQRLREDYGIPGTGAAGRVERAGNLDMLPFPIIHNGQTYRSRGYTNELRYISDSAQRLRYTLGVYDLQTNRDDTLPVFLAPNNYSIYLGNLAAGLPLTQGLDSDEPMIALPGSANTSSNNNALGLYGQINYDIADQLELTLAYRYDQDRRRQVDNNTGGIARKTFRAHQPKASLAWKPHSNLMIYATAAKGVRSGGFNKIEDPSDPGSFQLLFRAESLWNYEAGFKSDLFDRRLTFNGAAFYERVKDHQEFAFLPNVAAQIVYNIPRARIFGAEFDAVFRATSDIQLGLSAGYLNSNITKFDGTDAGFATDVPGTGKQLPGIYHWQYTAFAEHSAAIGRGELISRIEWSHKGDLQWFIDGLNKDTSVGLLGGSLTYQIDRWKMAIWGDNLANKKYYAAYEPSTQTGLGADITYPAVGRRYGVKLTVNF